jgi:hypothetical protein
MGGRNFEKTLSARGAIGTSKKSRSAYAQRHLQAMAHHLK